MNEEDVVRASDGSIQRYNGGKHPVRFTPIHLLEDCNRVLEFGAKKYEAWGWAKGMPWSVPYECAIRHLAAWYRGEDTDPESGLPHLGHVMANLVMLTHFASAHPSGDNRPSAIFSPDKPT